MSIHKFKDWSGWLDGLRTSAIKAGATSVVTNLTVFTTTNTVSSMNIPGIQNTGEHWKSALIGLVAQFLLHTVYAAAVYVQANPDAQVVTETCETTHITKDQTGAVTEVGSSKTVTTTPVDGTNKS